MREVQTKTDDIDALGHAWGEWTQTQAPTCSAAGVEERVCTRDATHKETREVAIDPNAHDWGEWVVTKEATETEEGSETRAYKLDASHAEIRVIPVKDHEHQLTKVDAKAATCTEPGNTEYWMCSQGDKPCGRYFADAEGTSEINLEDTVVAATGHEWGEWTVTKAATCTEAGTDTRTCAHDASHTQTREVAALGHEWGAWVVAKEATVDEEGEQTRTCAHDAAHIQTRAIPKIDPSPDPELTPDPEPAPDPDPEPAPDPTPAAISYENIEGNGTTWTKGSTATADFTFERSANDNETFSHFTGIQVDGTDVDGSNYTAESGSVIVKLKPAYLETLSAGEHTITALFDDGNSASAKFTIKAAATPAPKSSAPTQAASASAPARQTARTADAVPPIAAVALLTLAAAAAATIARRRVMQHK